MDDDSPTVLEAVGPSTITDLVPEAPDAPFEVMFDRVTVDRHGGADAASYRTLDVWTKNRVYRIDSTMTCVEVIELATAKNDAKHAMIGLRLLGGHRRYGKTIHQTKPFPVPGTEAVFASREPNGQPKVTSRVERVVLHVRVTTVVLSNDNAWEDVTNAILNPGSGQHYDD